MGRRFRTPQVLPALEIDGNVLSDASQIQKAFEAHFAIPENGNPCSVHALLDAAADEPIPSDVIDCANLPSAVDLACGFLALKCRRAQGASLIPAEAYRGAATAAVLAHFPIYMKSAARGTFPLLWRGTKSVAIPRVGKPAASLQGWRHIALLEAGAKGLGKAVRQHLTAGLAKCAGLGQHGALPHQSLGAPAHTVTAYAQVAHRRKISGAVVFLDGQAAYYSVIREFLFPADGVDEVQALRGFLEKLHHDEAQQDALLASFTGPGILASAGVPREMCDFVKSSLRHSWFSICPYDGQLQATRTGTVPGTPLADILFQYAQSVFMHGLSKKLQAAGLQTTVCKHGAVASHPAWADDVAVLAPLTTAACVPNNVTQMVRMADVCSRQTGVALNFDAGKTECVCFFHGRGSKEVKRQVLSCQQPAFQVSLESGKQVQVRIVPQYVHLGSVLHFSTSCTADVQNKSRIADATFARLCSTLLRNPELSVAEKRQLVLGLVHAKLDFGSGLWMPRTPAETNLIHHSFMKHWRAACRPLLGVSSKYLEDDAVCSMLGVLPPADVLRVARVRQLRVLCMHPDPFLREVVSEACDWLQTTIADFNAMVHACAHDSGFPVLVLEHCWSLLRPHALKVPGLLRSYKRHVLRVLQVDSEFHLQRCRTLWKFEQAGGLQLKLVQAETELPHACDFCGARFQRRSGLAVHKLKMHGVQSVLSVAGGTECQVCRTMWWSTARFRAHLEKTEGCRLVYANADLHGPAAWEIVGHRKDGAWQPPVAVQGPCPWWATLRPGQLPQVAPATSVSSTQLLRSLLSQECDQSFEKWCKQALRLVLQYDHCCYAVDGIVQDSQHAWRDVIRVLLILKQNGFVAEHFQHGTLSAMADGHNVWLCFV